VFVVLASFVSLLPAQFAADIGISQYNILLQ
jgi:hypothetical protein